LKQLKSAAFEIFPGANQQQISDNQSSKLQLSKILCQLNPRNKVA